MMCTAKLIISAPVLVISAKGTETLPPGRGTEGLGSRRISDGLQGSYLDGFIRI